MPQRVGLNEHSLCLLAQFLEQRREHLQFASGHFAQRCFVELMDALRNGKETKAIRSLHGALCKCARNRCRKIRVIVPHELRPCFDGFFRDGIETPNCRIGGLRNIARVHGVLRKTKRGRLVLPRVRADKSPSLHVKRFRGVYWSPMIFIPSVFAFACRRANESRSVARAIEKTEFVSDEGLEHKTFQPITTLL